MPKDIENRISKACDIRRSGRYVGVGCNAMEEHPGVQFEACDIVSYNGEEGMPDVRDVLEKAALLLRPGGKLAHILNQSRAGLILVKRGLPLTKSGSRLAVLPVPAKTADKARVGYLAVLEKDR
jgi:hypothetical protein